MYFQKIVIKQKDNDKDYKNRGGIINKLGILGGLGPLATAYFFQLILDMTDAKIEQEHIEISIYNKPCIPDRTSYILDRGKDNPVPAMIEVGKVLESQSVDYIAIPCITAHYFLEELQTSLSVPIIDGVDETVQCIKKHGIKRVGIMATAGTISSGLFQKKLEKNKIESILPKEVEQEYINHIIYNNVKINKPVDMDKFNAVADGLRNMGAESIILGCSELSLIKGGYKLSEDFLDTMEVLARSSVINCKGKLKEEYKYLL